MYQLNDSVTHLLCGLKAIGLLYLKFKVQLYHKAPVTWLHSSVNVFAKLYHILNGRNGNEKEIIIMLI